MVAYYGDLYQRDFGINRDGFGLRMFQKYQEDYTKLTPRGRMEVSFGFWGVFHPIIGKVWFFLYSGSGKLWILTDNKPKSQMMYNLIFEVISKTIEKKLWFSRHFCWCWQYVLIKPCWRFCNKEQLIVWPMQTAEMSYHM